MADDTEADDTTASAVTRAAQVLYAANPDEFMSLRTDLSARARKSGDASAAKRIGALRKPTAAASMVNRLVHDDPSSVERLVDLGARMREAQDALDATLLRDLSTERRALVGDLCRAALKPAGQRSPSTALEDEIAATFDAAVADPDVASRLGYLHRAEHWSGFGFAEVGSPELTLVRGGMDTTPAKPSRRTTSAPQAARKAAPQAARKAARQAAGKAARQAAPNAPPEAAPKMPAGAKRRLARALEEARSAFDLADTSLTAVESEERTGTERVRTLTSELSELQQELDEAKRDLDRARREVKSARAKRRAARSALDRAVRQAPD